jgi:polysaccharide export outer membrane protein
MKIIRHTILLLLLFTVAGPGAWAADSKEYTLGAGDIIKVSVFQNPDLALETRVSESGLITYPLLGSVSVGGLTVADAEKKIAKALRDGGFVLQPQVNILPTLIRGTQVSVLGQVNKPGRYPLDTLNIKLSEALAQAGGITPAGADTVVLSGLREGKPVHMEIDLPSIFLSGAAEKDVRIQGGDVIYVHRAPMFYIYGEVQRPGSYRLERDMTVVEALALGGGLTQRGTERGLRIHRRGANGRIEIIEPRMDDVVRSADVLYIRQSIF